MADKIKHEGEIRPNVCVCGGGIYANSTVQLEIIEESQRDCLKIFS